MTEMEAIRARHSVRQYLNNPLKPDELAALRGSVDACNKESGLHIQLVTNEPRAFEGTMAHYGKFSVNADEGRFTREQIEQAMGTMFKSPTGKALLQSVYLNHET